jgi:putative nucleotidyltransferase with HDIG domain
MRLVATASVQQGTILAKTIYNDIGQVLLSEGVVLKEGLLSRLQDKGIDYIYIKEEATEDIKAEEPISRELKRNVIVTIESTFKQIQKDSFISDSFVIERASQRFQKIIRNILDEIMDHHDVISLLADVYTYDNYIFTHSFNVTLYSLAIGMELKLSPKELEILGLGAMLHDIGKMKVPENILFKPGKLTALEFEKMKKHSEDGFNILRNVPTISLLVAHCAYQHHERLNGTGYPRGIKGKQIHPFGKIIAVADVFDAVTSNRVYRKAMLPHVGLEILFAGSGELFEEKIVTAFRRAVAIYPVGLTVELSDKRTGVVSKQNVGMGDRPVIRILKENGRVVPPYEVNLVDELSVMITKCDTDLFKQTQKN